MRRLARRLSTMASIACSKHHIVLTSGSKVKVISFSDPSNHQIFELSKPEGTDKEKKEEEEEEVEEASDEKRKENEERSAAGIDPHLTTGRVLAVAFSSSGRLFAACTDQKALTLWVALPSWDKRWTRSVTKRCMALTFDTSEEALFVADKAGDVYRYDVQDASKGAVLVLGHVSMLLDVVISPDDKFIMTAERDEKIRVSCLPNAYNIHSFCLGHTEFVSRLAILQKADLLVSGAGDTSLRLWDYRTSEELCRSSLDWATSAREMGMSEKCATVTRISCCNLRSLVAVTILRESSVPVYHVTQQDGRWAFREVKRIACMHPPWSLTFDLEGRLWILLPDPAKPLVVYDVQPSGKGEFKVMENTQTDSLPSAVALGVREDWCFLQCSCDIQSVYSGLHKVPFDNMPDYLQRKRQRIESSISKKGCRRRRTKNRRGKKRAGVEIGGKSYLPTKKIDVDDDEDDDVDEDEELEALPENAK